MKTAKILFVAVLALFLTHSQTALGQWDGSGGVVHLTTEGDIVGIGTDTPLGKVHIIGSSTFELAIQASVGKPDIAFLRNGNAKGQIKYEHGLNGLAFFVNGSNSLPGGLGGIPKLFLSGKAAGNVGIGTNTPAHKLDVEGTIKANEILVVPSVMPPDFVFEDDYVLRSLEEVEQYIDTHGHLPEIPSGAKMKAEGVGLSAMQMKLLQKIEELTLYLIEQRKEINQLTNELQTLQDRD